MNMTVPNYNPGPVACTQYNAVEADGTILTVADGDMNVMVIPAEGDVAQSEFGCLEVTEAAETNGNCYSSPERTRPNGADMTITGCSNRRVEYLSFIAGMATSQDADGCTTGFAAPKKNDNCAPCYKTTESGRQVMATQWACALDCDGSPVLDDAGECLYEVTVTGPFELVKKDQRFRSSSTVGNNNVSFTITLGENENLNGGPGGVFADVMLDEDGELGCWAWWKGLTTVPPPCDPQCECADSSGQFITLAGMTAGTQPVPVGDTV